LRAVVTGGAGFLGSHLCRRLLTEGWRVECLDSLLTGREENLEDLTKEPRFLFRNQDVTEPLTVEGQLDWVFHFASPASPIDYLRLPIQTLRTGAIGTLNALEVARERGASIFLASTSEVYGDPEVHPQPEGYWGNVNPIGPRSVYDEGKRFAEAATVAYHRTYGLRVRIGRIFNTYGPGMRRDDGRAVPTFIIQALRGEPITVHGDGRQTRSLCYVADLIDGVWRLTSSDVSGPVNLGNPEEVTVLELAERIRILSESPSKIVFTERPMDDPQNRCPDITRAQGVGWEPKVPLDQGLSATVSWARSAWGKELSVPGTVES